MIRHKRMRQTARKCGKTMTEQHHAKTCNINYIVGKYQKTGLIEHTNRHQPSYGDVSGADYEKAMSLVCEQETEFQELPSSVRKHYKNDVVKYLEAVGTAEGIEQHVALLDPQQPAEELPEELSEPEKETEPEAEPVT